MKPEEQFILIVEDSRTYAEALRRRIAKRLDFQLLMAGSLAEAEALLAVHREQVFIAVLDLNLPDAPNGEIVDHVLAHGITVVVLTATFELAVREQIVAKNVADYVVKESVHDLDYIVQLIRRIHLNQQVEVLIVDDSPTYRHVLRQHLLPFKYRVLEAGNGQEAVERLAEHPDIRLVITDNQMPGMDGFELITEVRRNRSKEDLAIIGLSAESGGTLSAKFLKRGANDFLVKPFSKEEFYCRVSQNIELIDLVREIKESSNRDYLTGLYNRRYFFDIGDKYLENARRNHISLTVAMLDIDFFKVVNDTYGHEAGDHVIRRLAELLTENLRKSDVIARFGGEEFCILAVNAAPGFVAQTFERLRGVIEAETLEYEGQEIRMTVSIGVHSRVGNTLADMIREADELLYAAKERGRNRVIIGGESG